MGSFLTTLKDDAVYGGGGAAAGAVASNYFTGKALMAIPETSTDLVIMGGAAAAGFCVGILVRDMSAKWEIG